MTGEEITAELKRLLDGAWCAGPVDEQVIRAAESELGVSFPPSYFCFLRTFGAAFRGYEFAGIDPNYEPGECPQFSSVVEDTLGYRGPHFPIELILISGDGGDYRFCLHSGSVDDDGECPVIWWGPGKAMEFLAPSFLEFVRMAASPSANSLNW